MLPTPDQLWLTDADGNRRTASNTSTCAANFFDFIVLLYLEAMAHGLAARGCRVTVFSAAFAGAPLTETVDGIRFVRRGSKNDRLRAGRLVALCVGGSGGSTWSWTSRTACRSSPAW